MPRPKAVASLSGPFDCDLEGDSTMADALPTPESNQENAKPTVKGRGRAKAAASATTKAKSKTRRASVRLMGEKKNAAPKKAAAKRAPLKEQSSNRNPEDTEEVDDFDRDVENEAQGHQSAVSADELVAVKQPVRKARTAAKGKKPTSKKQTDSETLQQIKGTANDGEFEYTPVTARQTKPSKTAPGRPLANKRKALPEAQVPLKVMSEKVIPDTQDVPMEVEPSELLLQSDEDEEIPQSVFRRTNNAPANPRARQASVIRKQVGADFDIEKGGGDPSLRRKLGEMTKKFENLDLKYKRLTEVGVKDAEANFEKLKLSSEAKSKGMVINFFASRTTSLTSR